MILSKRNKYLNKLILSLSGRTLKKLPKTNLLIKLGYWFIDPYKDYNDETKSIFIHIPKTAGISVSETVYGVNRGHSKILHYQIFDRDKFQKYYKFSFVRNPWDRFISAYLYLKKGGRNKIDKEWSAKYLQKYNSVGAFINHLGQDVKLRNKILSHQHFTPQVNFLKNNKGEIAVDFIGRFEALKEDFQVVKSKLQIDKELKKININRYKDKYNKYYNSVTYDIIREIYSEDIEVLGYQI